MDSGKIGDASDDWEEYAQEILVPIVEDIVDDRETIVMPEQNMIIEAILTSSRGTQNTSKKNKNNKLK